MNLTLTPYQWYAAVLRGEPPDYACIEHSTTEEELLHCGVENGVIQLTRYHLTNFTALDQLPEPLRNIFQENSRHFIAAELVQQDELERILHAFKSSNIKPLLIKGTPLAYTLYPQPHLRSRCDTDLLFDTKDSANKAWGILQEMEYQRPHTVSGEFISTQFMCSRSDQGGVTHVFDFHWKVNNAQRFARALPFEMLAESAITIDSLGEDALTLNPVHALLLACMHRIAHKAEGSENRLIWLYDIHLLCAQLNSDQWEKMISLATEKELCSICLDGLKQAHATLHSAIPDHVTQSLEEGASREKSSAEISASRMSSELSNLRYLPGWRERLTFIRETLFPDADYMLKKYNTTYRSLLPLLYIQRAFQGFRKRL